jgi:gamma-glutamyl-gamma-aminobutyraldehyde dehydrogenase
MSDERRKRASEEEPLQIANSTRYGLAASVWISNSGRAHRSPGGFKQSGFGRDLSLHARDKYMGLETTWMKF